MSTPNRPATQTATFVPEHFIQLRTGKNGYEAIRVGAPDPWATRFRDSVYPNLDEEIANTRKDKFGRNSKINAHSRYCMYGKHKSGSVSLDATIIIQCSESKCTKLLRKCLSHNEPPYLRAFGQPWLVYTKKISWSARSEAMSDPADGQVQAMSGSPSGSNTTHDDGSIAADGLPSTQSSESGRDTDYAAPNFPQPVQTLYIGFRELFHYGLPIAFLKLILPSQETRYAVIGGIVRHQGNTYALTTGHTFFADSDSLERPGEHESNSTDSRSVSEMGTSDDSGNSPPPLSRITTLLRPDQHLEDVDFTEVSFDPTAFSFDSPPTLMFSFLGDDRIGNVDDRRRFAAHADWALVPWPGAASFENLSTMHDIVTLAKPMLEAGQVQILSGSARPQSGSLLQGPSFLQTARGSLATREIRMDAPLPYTVSGCWVVQGRELLGHVVACSSDGLSCYMLAMEQVFDDIEYVTGARPSLINTETMGDHYQTVGLFTLPETEETPEFLTNEAKSTQILAPVEASSSNLNTPATASAALASSSEKNPDPVTYCVEFNRILHSGKGPASFRLENAIYRPQAFRPNIPSRLERAGGYVFQVCDMYTAATPLGGASAFEQEPMPLDQLQPPDYDDSAETAMPGPKIKVGTYLRIRSNALRTALEKVVEDAGLLSYSTGLLTVPEPFCALYLYENDLQRIRDSTSDAEQRHDLSHLLKFSSEYYEKELSLESTRRSMEIPRCTFRWSWLLFRPGTLVYTWQNGKMIACAVDKCRLTGLDNLVVDAMHAHQDLQFSDRLKAIELTLFYLEFDGELIGRRTLKISIWPFKGVRPIKSLPAYPVRYEDQEVLDFMRDTGKRYVQFTKPSYAQHKGQTLSKLRLDLDGRVVIDMETFYGREELGLSQTPRLNIPHDAPGHASGIGLQGELFDAPGVSPLEGARRYRALSRSTYEHYKGRAHLNDRIPHFIDPKSDISGLASDIYVICARQVYGFVLGQNVWELLDLDNISDIVFERGALSTWIAPRDMKRVIQAFCSTHVVGTSAAKPQATDLLLAKARDSSILLLHGPPGVGKTLSCECIAEETQRPLLRLSVKDLGVRADRVYETLQSWMVLARRWQAVLLIDEADIYLERRSASNPDNNALVAVFLHLLDHYEGILVLTTNRPGTIDDAVFSRVHLSLHYPRLDHGMRAALWQMLFDNLKETRPDIRVASRAYRYFTEDEDVRGANLSGREMKNVLNTAVSMLGGDDNDDSEDSVLQIEHLQVVIKRLYEMRQYLDELHRGDESHRAERRFERGEFDVDSSTRTQMRAGS